MYIACDHLMLGATSFIKPLCMKRTVQRMWEEVRCIVGCDGRSEVVCGGLGFLLLLSRQQVLSNLLLQKINTRDICYHVLTLGRLLKMKKGFH